MHTRPQSSSSLVAIAGQCHPASKTKDTAERLCASIVLRTRAITGGKKRGKGETGESLVVKGQTASTIRQAKRCNTPYKAQAG